jgi:hypothetical protein
VTLHQGGKIRFVFMFLVVRRHEYLSIDLSARWKRGKGEKGKRGKKE